MMILWLCQIQEGQPMERNNELLAESPNNQPVWMKLASYKRIGLQNERQDRPSDYLQSLLGRNDISRCWAWTGEARIVSNWWATTNSSSYYQFNQNYESKHLTCTDWLPPFDQCSNVIKNPRSKDKLLWCLFLPMCPCPKSKLLVFSSNFFSATQKGLLNWNLERTYTG